MGLFLFRMYKGNEKVDIRKMMTCVRLPIELDLGPYLDICSFRIPLLLTIILSLITIIALSVVTDAVPLDSKSISQIG
jgi:hypothetical protein